MFCNCCLEPLGGLGMDGMDCQHVASGLKETWSVLQDYPGPWFIVTKVQGWETKPVISR